MRTDSLALELHTELRKTVGEAGARQIRYKLACACGTRDAKMFHERLQVTDPTMKLALGPVHFAHVGWANVNIRAESAPQASEDYFLVYDHPYSFEAASFLENGVKSNELVCFMNAGYSAGWCEVSFGVELKAEEISCRARGDETCTFVMAHPKQLEQRARPYRETLGGGEHGVDRTTPPAPDRGAAVPAADGEDAQLVVARRRVGALRHARLARPHVPRRALLGDRDPALRDPRAAPALRSLVDDTVAQWIDVGRADSLWPGDAPTSCAESRSRSSVRSTSSIASSRSSRSSARSSATCPRRCSRSGTTCSRCRSSGTSTRTAASR